MQASTNVGNMQAQAQILAVRQATQERIAAVVKKLNIYLQTHRKGALLKNVLGNWQDREGEWLSAIMTLA